MKDIFYLLATITIGIFILITGKFVFAPLFLATFFAILVSPVVNFLDSKKFHPSLSVLLTVLLLFVTLLSVIVVIFMQYNSMIENMPSIIGPLKSYIVDIEVFLSSQFNISEASINSSTLQLETEIKSKLGKVFSVLFLSISSIISYAVLVPIFTFLILNYRKDIMKLVQEYSLNHGAITFAKWVSILAQIKHIVRNYLLGVLLITLVLATLNTIGLAVLGIPFAIVLGTSAAVLSIMPYIGNMIGGGLAALMALASGNLWSAVTVVILFACIQTLEGNFITPKIMGNQVGINPLVVILALLVGGFIWGIIGMVIAIPIVAIIRIFLDKKLEIMQFSIIEEDKKQ